MKNRIRWLLVVALLVLVADQGTKYLAVSQLTGVLDGRAGWSRLEGFLRERPLEDGPDGAGAGARPALRPYTVLEDFWQLRYVENPGAAWGLLSTLPDSVRAPFFHTLSLAALGFILWMYVRLGARERLARLALALVGGGALGNAIDRVVGGYVIDFIDLHWRNQPGMRWPTFNLADTAICVGVALMLADALRLRRMAGGLLQEEPDSMAAG